MQRTLAAMVVCLVVGAGGMWVLSNFRLKVEAVGGEPTLPPPPTTAKDESPLPLPTVLPPADPPQPLPPNLLAPQPTVPVPTSTPEVKPASASLPVAVNAAALGIGAGENKDFLKTAEIEVVEVLDGTAGTDAISVTGNALVSPRDVLTRTVTLNLLVKKKAELVDAADGKWALQIVAQTDGPNNAATATAGVNLAKDTVTPTAALNLSGTDFQNQRKVTLKAQWVKAGDQPLSAQLRFPQGGTDPVLHLPTGDKPTIPAVFNGKYADTNAVSGGTAQLFPGFARVQVKSKAANADHEFTLYTAGPKRTVSAVPVITDRVQIDGEVTEYTLKWGVPDGTPAQLRVKETTAGKTSHESEAVNVAVNNLPPFPAITLNPNSLVPVVGTTDVGTVPPTPSGRFLLGTSTVKLTAAISQSPAPTAPFSTHGKLLLFVDKQPKDFPPPSVPAVSIGVGTTTSIGGIDFANDGDHVLYLAVEAGGLIATQRTVNVRVFRGGLAVTRVSPTDFSNSADYRIRIAFSPDRPLKKSTAETKENYTLIGDYSGATDLLAAVAPQYDETTNTVTLQLTTIPQAGLYTLSVLGTDAVNGGGTVTRTGLRDIYGNPLGGVFGDDGKVFKFSIVQPVGGAQPSVSVGVTLGTGPNVTYPEYTHFRKVPDGFNPSDRVETRVVRLYYTRDAHRVAQIVNRDVRSYNAATVDVRRRAADRARDDANAATDARKRLEGDAVQAAVDARAAETRLRDLQARLTTARTESATATTQLSQRQLQLEQFQRAGTRDQTNVGVRRDTDTSTDAAQTRLDRLTADVTQAEAAVTAAKQSTAARPADLDTAIISARQKLDASQRDFRVEYADRRAAAEQTKEVKDAPAQTRDEAIQTAILRADTGGVLRTKSTTVQTDQLAVEQLQTAREALVALPTLRQAQADAERDLTRAKAVASGRAATDTGADVSRDTATDLQSEIRKLNGIVANTTAMTKALEEDIVRASGEVQAKRTKEVELNLRVREYEQQELRGRETQFRREVAAARADPDTYAAGVPDSDDPVRQCSISVIGEGLIQLRGPVKGLNVIRTMINQMDAPTGQVRIGVHTVQVNGERVEKMDKVVASIQRYLDHSRFLTTQSAQMLRKAVTLVASRKAEEAAMTVAPGCSRAEQDMKYLHCFFGKDFIDELRQLDSEFLRTGNKLLSLHSMDSTSLSAALFLMALAKNDIRLEILQEWQSQLQGKLPQAEMIFYLSGLACGDKCEACCDKKFCVLAQNAKFESFLGFFNAEVQGNDTLTPVQREFVRLAQIFKTRLVTELELKQRVMERTLLEERLGNYREELEKAKLREDTAKAALLAVQATLQTSVVKVSTSFGLLNEELKEVETEFGKNDETFRAIAQAFKEADPLRDVTGPPMVREGPVERVVVREAPPTLQYRGTQRTLPTSREVKREEVREVVRENNTQRVVVREEVVLSFTDKLEWIATAMEGAAEYLDRFNYLTREYEGLHTATVTALRKYAKAKQITGTELAALQKQVGELFALIREQIAGTGRTTTDIAAELRKDRPDVGKVVTEYARFRDDLLAKLRSGSSLRQTADDLFTNRVGPAFRGLEEAFINQQAAQRLAEQSRRPLDEKKLLDMLVDEMEDKFIELLDGTRAHTANVDNYLKALATALDDDFNTQFYQPAFRKIRTLGAGWDVQLGQIESTSVLTNNRAFGKVSPAASMEFDLPRRDIALREAFKGAKAAVEDYGALLNDPVFLSLVKAYGGMPPSAQFGGASGGLPAVRNVLPGLGGSADEMLLAQAGSPRREFGTNLEALIPDPAIYKFETGTGYEIRPVISPDGQAVVFNFDYMYTTDVREPVRADEKHLGRVKRHFVHTDVQLGNYEMREVSKYWVSLKAARTGQGVQLLQDIPGVGALFRPAPSASSSLQQNLIYSQAAIFPTLFDLMGLRYAPAVADIDPEFTKNDEFVVRGRRDYLRQFIFDYGASRVDDALRIMYGERRPDLYRSQHTIPWVHPNGYQGPGLRQRDAKLEEDYDPLKAYPPTKYAPGMHTPTQPDRDPFGMPGGPITVPGSGYSQYDSRPMPHGGYSPLPSGVPLMAKPPTAVPAGKEPTVKPPTGIGTAKVYTAKPLGTLITHEPAPKPQSPTPTVTPLPPDRLPPPTTPAKAAPTPAAPISIRPENNSAPLPSIPPR